MFLLIRIFEPVWADCASCFSELCRVVFVGCEYLPRWIRWELWLCVLNWDLPFDANMK